MQPERRVLVVGIGNRWRGDDAVGLLVAERLAAHRLPGVEAICCEAPGPGLVDTWRPTMPLILVDAVVSGAPPGTIHRVDLAHPLPAGISTASSHAFDLAAIIALARVLDRLPDQCLLFGIEACNLTVGDRLTPAVVGAIAGCVAAILATLSAHGINRIERDLHI